MSDEDILTRIVDCRPEERTVKHRQGTENKQSNLFLKKKVTGFGQNAATVRPV
jgi:hypothetical protein